MTGTPLDAAHGYARRGWRVIPIPAGNKRPVLDDWQDLAIPVAEALRYFGGGCNVGILLGSRSGALVDIDLDCAEALSLADIYLPVTGAIFGRPSKPRSHRLYVAPGAHYESFGDPLSGGKNTLVELRADGRDGGAHQTIFPPSIADGERREWHGDTIAPAVIDPRALRAAVAWLAIGCLVTRHVSRDAAERPGPDLPRLLWEFDHVLGRTAHRWAGWAAPDEPQHRFRPRRRHELTADEIDLAEMVRAIPNDCDWEGWNSIGLAIFAATNGSDHGGIVFDNFSARSPKYNPYTTIERWRHYNRSPPSRTGIGKLISLALQAGWRPSEHTEATRRATMTIFCSG
jgi:hypothetical protein